MAIANRNNENVITCMWMISGMLISYPAHSSFAVYLLMANFLSFTGVVLYSLNYPLICFINAKSHLEGDYKIYPLLDFLQHSSHIALALPS